MTSNTSLPSELVPPPPSFMSEVQHFLIDHSGAIFSVFGLGVVLYGTREDVSKSSAPLAVIGGGLCTTFGMLYELDYIELIPSTDHPSTDHP